jgi:hypothetical protein
MLPIKLIHGRSMSRSLLQKTDLIKENEGKRELNKNKKNYSKKKLIINLTLI